MVRVPVSQEPIFGETTVATFRLPAFTGQNYRIFTGFVRPWNGPDEWLALFSLLHTYNIYFLVWGGGERRVHLVYTIMGINITPP